jgi:Trk-type K+ transport system membrane component
MMYVSAYPIVIPMRTSNVYEERSLGIYSDDASINSPAQEQATATAYGPEHANSDARHRVRFASITSQSSHNPKNSLGMRGVGAVAPGPDSSNSRLFFIKQQVRGQLAHDIWWLALSVFIITTIETSCFLRDPITYSVFNVIFEVVSAYGCVGLSVGLPNAAYSFCGGWHAASKLLLCLVMLRGRHRGLPVALDRAVRLPGDDLAKEEEEDQRIRQSRTVSRIDIQST